MKCTKNCTLQNFCYFLTLSCDGADHDGWTDEKLGVDTIGIHVARELEEERSGDSRRWRGCHGDGGVGLEEEGIVEWQDAVANGENLSGNCSHLWPAVEFLCSLK